MPQESQVSANAAQSEQSAQIEQDDQTMPRNTTSRNVHDDVLDDVLDDISSVLETNAEDYVSSFVQKGGE